MLSTVDKYSSALQTRASENRLRRLKSATPISAVKIILDGEVFLNFSSNDYLGLSQHPELKERASQYIAKYGTGSTASRLICGNLDVYAQLEAKLAKLKGTEAALILGSGFQTNLSILPVLADAGGLIVLDKFSHNSLLQGAILSSASWMRYRHNDFTHLREKLHASAEKSYTQRWIVTESVFSMDGDCCNLDSLTDIAAEYSAYTMLDEAHATGVLGKNGMGLSVGNPHITLTMGTFGKGLGSFGAYVACSHTMRDYLINFCSGFVYSTGLPPAALGAIDAALDVVPGMHRQRNHLAKLSNYLRHEINELGFDTADSSTQIIPIIVGSDNQAMALAAHLMEHGIYAPCIRPPTVPPDSARIRISLSSEHSEADLQKLLGVLKSWHA